MRLHTKLVTARDVHSIVAAVGVDQIMDEMMGELEVALRNYDPAAIRTPPRQGFAYETPGAGLLEWMPAHDAPKHTATVKVVGYHPSNPEERHLPTIISTISEYDTETGHLKAIADGTVLTAIRTGAVSGVATSVLASTGSRVVGLVGLGAQAVTQLHAISRRFEVETVLAFDASEKQLKTFRSRIEGFDKRWEIVPTSVESIVQRSDIICTSTSIDVGEGPLFDDMACRPWLHVNAVGSDFPGKAEIPLELLERSFVVADFLPQALAEGECQRLARDQIAADLPTIVCEPETAAAARSTTSVFDSTGWALTDQVAMRVLMGHAERLNAFSEVLLEAAGGDPYSPYQS